MAKKFNAKQVKELQKRLAEKEKKARSQWGKAVLQDAQNLLGNVLEWIEYGDDKEVELTEKYLLNGAKDWEQYSWGGNGLVYDADIAKHYCTPSELKKVGYDAVNGGVAREPNAREQWLDVQTRALRQAYWAIRDEINGGTEFSMIMGNGEKCYKGITYKKTKGQGKGSLRGKGGKSNFSIDYISEESCDLADFPAWSGAKDRLKEICELGIEDEAEEYIKEMFYAETPTDTQINDLLWFDMDDWIDEHKPHDDNFKIYALEWDEFDIDDAKENDIELPTELELTDVHIDDLDDVRGSLNDAIYDEVGYSPNYYEYESESGNFSLYELKTIHDGRKSFGGKAQVEVDDKTGLQTLYSYGTKVATFNPATQKVDFFNKDLYSVTTKRHIREFLAQHGMADTKFSIVDNTKEFVGKTTDFVEKQTDKVVGSAGILMF